MRLAALLAAVALAAACGRGGISSDTARAADSQRAAGATTSAADECVRGEPEPVLAPTGMAPSARPRFERTGKLSAVEEVRLDDTTQVRITHGGCAHYVETYAFTIQRATRDTADATYWLTRAIDHLRALPVVEARRIEIDQIVDALNQALRAAEPYRYGDPIRASEMALVWFRVGRAGEGRVVVEVVFDVAL